MKKQHAFSLVELSVVLVILGLLAGGVLSGRALIRAAELRAIPTEFQLYSTAALTFRDKYFALPGDMTIATQFWGTSAHCPGLTTQPSTDKTTCNGDGDGLIEDNAATSNEVFRFWQHLANASLIEGTYTGVTGPNHASHDAVIGLNVPRSKMGNAGFNPNPLVNVGTADPHYFDQPNGTVYNFGAEHGTASTYAPILKPEEAWNIDTKIDDGRPAYGNITALKNSSTLNPNCTTSDVPSTAQYALSLSDKLCSLVIRTGL